MENNGIMNSINNVMNDQTNNNTKANLNSVYGEIMNNMATETAIVESSPVIDAAIIDGTTNNDVTAIINGDVSNSFNVIVTRGQFSARESYAVTRPDSDDDNTISIGKQARNEIVDIDRFIIYSFVVDDTPRVGICIFAKNGKKYVTTSTAFIKEFILLDRLYKMDGEQMDRIKIIHKESKNKTADGQKMFYPLPLGM